MVNGSTHAEARARSLATAQWQGGNSGEEFRSLGAMLRSRAKPEGLESYGLPGLEQGWTGGFLGAIRARIDGPEKIEWPYLQNWLIHACVARRADSLASLPARIWRDREDDATRIEAGPLWQVLVRPNPWMSSRRFWELVQTYRMLETDCFILLLDDQFEPIAAEGQIPRWMVPVRGGMVEHEVDSQTGRVARWRYSGQHAQTWEPFQVVQLAMINPYNPLRGLGTAQVALRLAQQDYQMDRYDDSILANHGIPSVVLSSDNPLTAEQAKQAEDRVQLKVGGPRGAGKPLVLGNGLKPVNEAFTPVEMQFLEKRGSNLQAIMALFGVTKPLLAITDDVNRANAKEAVAVFLEHVVIPDARKIEDQFQELFIANLRGPERQFAFGFDSGNVEAFKEDRSLTVQRVKQWYDMGVSVQKAAEIEGLDVEIEETDLRPPPEPRQPLEFTAPRRLAMDPRAEANRAEYLAFDRALSPHDQGIARTVERVQREYVLASIKALREHAGEMGPEAYAFDDDVDGIAEMLALILPDILGFADKLSTAMGPQLSAVLDQEAARIAKVLGETVPNLTSQTAAAAAHTQARAIKVAEGTMSTLAQYVREAMARVLIDEGATVQTITRAIREGLDKLRAEGQLIIRERLAERALRIARTEAGGIGNYARVQEMALQGVTHHEWVDSGDEHVRDQHSAVHGEVVRIGETFSNGLRWPLDDQASDASQVVNCRCLTVAAFPEDPQ